MIDPLAGTEFTGERFVPTSSAVPEIGVNVRRYLEVLPLCAGKSVLDVGCGSGLGTYIYSLAATHVTAVDLSPEAVDYAQRFPYVRDRVSFRVMDVREDLPSGRFDLAVCLEVLEHLDEPAKLLAKIRKAGVKELFFSLPLESLACSSFHRYAVRGLKDVTDLIDPFVRVDQYRTLDRRWIVGHGTFK